MAGLRRAMDRWFDEGMPRPWRMLGWDAGEGNVPLDLYETDDALVVRASLPEADEILPWDFIDHGTDKAFLRAEYERALAGASSEPARKPDQS
jgi:hypothetical protein